MWMIGAATQVVASELSEPSFAVVTEPVLSTTPVSGQLPLVAAVVGDEMWTVNVLPAFVVPAGTVAGPQVRMPAVMAQLPLQPAPWPSICQSRPAFVGSTSVRLTPFASPEPVL